MLNHRGRAELLGKTRVLIDYAGGSDPVYIGKAAPHTEEDEAGWQVIKLTYDGNNNVTNVEYANETAAPNNKWSLRTTYAYGPV